MKNVPLEKTEKNSGKSRARKNVPLAETRKNDKNPVPEKLKPQIQKP